MIRETKCDQKLIEELLSVGKSLSKTDGYNYDVVTGKTMCAHDFYEGDLVLNYFFRVLKLF